MECAPENGKKIAEGLFWLHRTNGVIDIAHWFEGNWFWMGNSVGYSPKELWTKGWKVLKEVDYPEGYTR